MAKTNPQSFDEALQYVQNAEDGARLLDQYGGRQAYGVDPMWTKIVDKLNNLHEAPVTPLAKAQAGAKYLAKAPVKFGTIKQFLTNK